VLVLKEDSSTSNQDESVNLNPSSAVAGETSEYNQSRKTDGKNEELNQQSKQESEVCVSPENTSSVSDSRPDGAVKEKKQRPCHFFLKKGYCHFGKRCRFQHIPSRLIGKKSEDASDEVNDKDKFLSNEKEEENQDVKEDLATKPVEDETGSKKKTEKAVGKSKKPCHFYAKGYCKFGNRCKFFHQQNKANKIDPTIPNENIKENDFIEVVKRKTQNTQIYKIEDLNLEQQVELRQIEINQLKKRFPKDKVTVVEETEEACKIRFTFTPTDPDWVKNSLKIFI